MPQHPARRREGAHGDRPTPHQRRNRPTTTPSTPHTTSAWPPFWPLSAKPSARPWTPHHWYPPMSPSAYGHCSAAFTYCAASRPGLYTRPLLGLMHVKGPLHATSGIISRWVGGSR